MGAWGFKQFISASGREAISDWRSRLLPGRRAVMDIFLKRIAMMEEWPSGTCKRIQGFPNCWELRWKAKPEREIESGRSIDQ